MLIFKTFCDVYHRCKKVHYLLTFLPKCNLKNIMKNISEEATMKAPEAPRKASVVVSILYKLNTEG